MVGLMHRGNGWKERLAALAEVLLGPGETFTGTPKVAADVIDGIVQSITFE